MDRALPVASAIDIWARHPPAVSMLPEHSAQLLVVRWRQHRTVTTLVYALAFRCFSESRSSDPREKKSARKLQHFGDCEKTPTFVLFVVVVRVRPWPLAGLGSPSY